MIRVSFRCNRPDNGLPLRKVYAVKVHGSYEDLELEGPCFPDPSNTFAEIEKPDGAADRCDQGFKIERHKFACRGWRTGFGNWCWDSTLMTGIDVLNLLITLRELRYRCTEGPGDLYEAFNSGAEITPKLVQEAL